MRHLFAAFLAVVLLGLPWLCVNYPDQVGTVFSALKEAGNQLAAVLISHNPKTVAGLQSTYGAAAIPSAPKLRILVVPGHEPGYGGAEFVSPFGHVYERDLTVSLAQDLVGFLRDNPHYQVFTTRDANGWNPALWSYFQNEWNGIIDWEQAHKDEIEKMTRVGAFTPTAPTVFHAEAPEDVAVRLYGIDKWADDNDMGIVIHVHFNDYPGHGENQPGRYGGFAVYVPDRQYYNGTTTRSLAETVSRRLGRYNPTSDFKPEQPGIVEDRDLIAVGSFNSVNAASMLIEYAYIYEPQLDDPAVQEVFLKELAYETYLGLEDFFAPAKAAGLASAYDTLVLPHKWDGPMTGSADSKTDAFALQTALIKDGDYPPAGKSMNDCPRTGKIGACTKAAMSAFQEKYGIAGEDGMAGPKTVDLLNRKFGAGARMI